jgi:hypothetical protein
MSYLDREERVWHRRRKSKQVLKERQYISNGPTGYRNKTEQNTSPDKRKK